MISFIVPGDPKPQGRPRFARFGKFVRTYDPPESATFKQKVAFFARQGKVPCIEGPLWLKADFYVRRPLKYMGKKYPDSAIPCPVRPDLDNYLKAIMDALNGIAYRDDGQIVSATVEKFYHAKSGQQQTLITLDWRENVERTEAGGAVPGMQNGDLFRNNG